MKTLAARLALVILTTLPCAACIEGGGPAPEPACPGEEVEHEGDPYCILIEEGFLVSDCPRNYPNGRDFDGAIACGASEAPDDLRDELEQDGYVGDRRDCSGQSCDSRFGIERCTDGETCALTCSAGECESQCEGNSTCAATCSGGGCTRTCLDNATCVFTCSGGDCTFRCAEGATCVTDCSGGDCTTTTADIPADITSCGSLCDTLGGLIGSELACVRTILGTLDHALDSSADCDLLDADACAACVGDLQIPDLDCGLAFDSCLGRTGLEDIEVGGGATDRCEGDADCLFNCPEGQCEFVCADSSSCIAGCSGGNCSMTCQDDAVCTFGCSGGQCLFRRAGDATWITSCSGGDCLFQYE